MTNSQEFVRTQLISKLDSNPTLLSSSGLRDKKIYIDVLGANSYALLMEFFSDSTAQLKEIDQSSAGDCRIEMKEEIFSKLLKGKVNVPLAVMSRKIKVKGDLGLAAQFALLLKEKFL